MPQLWGPWRSWISSKTSWRHKNQEPIRGIISVLSLHNFCCLNFDFGEIYWSGSCIDDTSHYQLPLLVALLSSIYALFGVLFTGLNNAMAHQISGMVVRSQPSWFISKSGYRVPKALSKCVLTRAFESLFRAQQISRSRSSAGAATVSLICKPWDQRHHRELAHFKHSRYEAFA